MRLDPEFLIVFAGSSVKGRFFLVSWSFYFLMQDKQKYKMGWSKVSPDRASFSLLTIWRIAVSSRLERISGDLWGNILHKRGSALRSDQAVQGFSWFVFHNLEVCSLHNLATYPTAWPSSQWKWFFPHPFRTPILVGASCFSYSHHAFHKMPGFVFLRITRITESLLLVSP